MTVDVSHSRVPLGERVMFKQLTTVGRIIRRGRRIHVAWFIAATLSMIVNGGFSANVDAYNCNSPHCYAYNEWQGDTTGAGTRIYIDGLSVITGPGRITNEQWLLESTNDGRCGGLCWVEVGYSYAALGNPPCDGVERYFHAAQIPAYGYVEICDFGQFRAIQTSEFHQYVGSTMYATDATHTKFWIQLDTPLGSIVYYLSLPSQFIDPNRIQVGAEISGTSGAVGYTAFWIQNYWISNTYQGTYQTTPLPFGSSGHNSQNVGSPFDISGTNWFAVPSNGSGGAWRAIPPPPP